MMRKQLVALLVVGAIYAIESSAGAQTATTRDPLPAWNDGKTKSAIIDFVDRATDKDSPDFVPRAKRIATFDNDGTLWSEQPMYFQAIFALDRIRAMSADHPEWRAVEPFQSAIAGDVKGLLAAGKQGLAKVLAVSHANITAEAFEKSVRDWLATAKHPKTGKPYTQMVFQPMLELLTYLRANGFKTYIVTGGGIDFVRVFAEEVYGIPPEQVVGSAIDAKFEMRDGVPTIVKEGKLVLIDDKAGKPVGIYRHIGRRPIFAAGNSDGDQQMLQYTTIPRSDADKSARFGMLVHHTDAVREYAYDRDSAFGRLDAALDAAPQRGWIVVDMKEDWRQVFPE